MQLKHRPTNPPEERRRRRRCHVAALLAPLLMTLSAGCGDNPVKAEGPSSSIVQHIKAGDPSSVAEIVTYLQRHPNAQLDTKLLPALGQVAAEEIETMRSSVADLSWAYDSGESLPSDGVIRLAAQLGRDQESLTQFAQASNRAAAHEVDLALKAGSAMAQKDQTSPFSAHLTEVGEASGVLSGALASAGTDTPEPEPVGTAEIYALLETPDSARAPAALTPDWLMDVLTVSIYRNAPTKYLPKALSARPAVQTPAQEDLLREWIDSGSAWQGREARSAMGVDIQSGWNRGWSRGASA